MTSKSQEKQNKAAIIDEQLTRIYDFKKRLGKGAYGIVWKALDKRNNQTVAVKKIFDAFRDETDAQRTFREIVFLKAFRSHANVVSLLNVHKAGNNLDVYLVFEYMESDLHNIIKKGTILKDVHKRYVMYQLINAIRFIHSGNVIHRDLKPCNILIDNKCRCKLADFGLARSVANQLSSSSDMPSTSQNPDILLTDYVATRWYRAPEILVASKKYTKGIDMWSLGCILGEMLRGKPLFQGSSTVNQIEKIVATLPDITEEDIASIGGGFGTALLNQQSQIEKGPTLDELLRDAPSDAMNLVKALLLLDPMARLTANDAIRHAYVQKFRNSSDEIELKVDILPPFNDDIRLTIQEYRDKVYEMSQISPQRVSQTRPSSKQSNSSQSKPKEVARKSSDGSVQPSGAATKKPTPPKKPVAAGSMAHESRSYSTLPKAGTQSTTHIKPSRVPIAPGVAMASGAGLIPGSLEGCVVNSTTSIKFEKTKSGSSSGVSPDCSPKFREKIQKQVRNLAAAPGRTNIHKRSPSPVIVAPAQAAAAGGISKVGSFTKAGKRSPDNNGATSNIYEIPKKGPNIQGKFPTNSNNLYCDQSKTQNLQSAVEASIFGSSVSNPKLSLPVGSTISNHNFHGGNGSTTSDYLKKPYDNSAYHLTGSTVIAKTLGKMDAAMINRKTPQIPLPGQVPQQQQHLPTQVPRKTNAAEQNTTFYHNNKHSHNIDVQRSVPSLGSNGGKVAQLRNTKSEQSTSQLSNVKKPEGVCYERRLRRLEEEIERYKKDVNSFCKHSYPPEKSKVPVKAASPPNNPARQTATMNMVRKYEATSTKTKLPSVGTTIPSDIPSHQIRSDHHLPQCQNDYPAKHREAASNLSSQQSSSKFFAGGGGSSGGGGGGMPVYGGGGGGGTSNFDFSNYRLNKYMTSHVKSAIKAANNHYATQYQTEMNAGMSHHHGHHHLAKYPYHYHQETAAANMRPVAVSKLV